MAAEEDGGISREAVLNYLDSHPEFAGEYVARERAAQGREGAPGSGLANHWQAQQLLSRRRGSRHFDHHPETAPGVSIFFPRRPLSPARRYNLRKRSPRKQPSREKLSKLNELDLMLELIRDIANELDMTNLCHKILTHVGILTNADRCSLFLVKGSRDNKYLVSRLFDVTPDSSVEQALHATGAQEIRVPFGCGIVGHVAKTKETVNIRNAYEDPRFNRAVDQRTGYHTHSILAMPICSADDEVLGVAQIINKATGGHEFTDKDEEVFRNYLTFCGISIANAQMFEMSITEYKRNQILLQLARNIFEEQTSVDKVVHKIMKDAQDLLKCERCSVFLTEDLHDEQDLSAHLSTEPPRPDNPKTSLQGVEFSKIFDLVSGSNEDNGVQSPSASTVAWLLESGLAKHVASTGEVLNLQNTREDSRFKFTEEAGTGFRITSALCLPIYNRERKIIGVAQLLNKHNNELFDENDEGMFEAFAIFCGLGIHHTQMYENVCRLMSKQKVALEVLSYHATAREEDVGKLLSTISQTAQLPAATKIGLYDFRFNDFVMSEDETVQGAVRLFLECDCVNKFRVPYDVLCRWVLSVKKNYRPVTYHNWRHAFNVTQTMFVILKTAPFSSMFSDVETFAMMTASLCHDLDHRGTNNAFQSKIESPLARLYSTSTMEHHHFDHSIMIMNSEGNNIFQSLSDEDYREALSILEDSILSTDLALYFKKRGSFISRAQGGVTDWTVEDNKSLLRAMMMTACDVSAICKPWEVQKKVAELVYSEFFQQGDIERTKLHQKPIDIMDREKKDELPKMQVGFIDSICMPLYKVMAEKWPSLYPLYEGCRSNRDHWQALAQQKATIVLPEQTDTTSTAKRLASTSSIEDDYSETSTADNPIEIHTSDINLTGNLAVSSRECSATDTVEKSAEFTSEKTPLEHLTLASNPKVAQDTDIQRFCEERRNEISWKRYNPPDSKGQKIVQEATLKSRQAHEEIVVHRQRKTSQPQQLCKKISRISLHCTDLEEVPREHIHNSRVCAIL
ncbi:PREDICTED: cGMP-specific 3',5'-cyclic phosphodiesterase-like isoform X2 [Branchiostoma belcheri]|uniref:Phosphodiesterase n=1 Tax=Branchiostoma belcheri TaxID=7741 RepID=A0A6P5A481_BRABE|nr:PREDICTED: cGMP-specific 3',5'-cyclic phosphodiesterase-like isoform X2 [Branchiostoma belcheri]